MLSIPATKGFEIGSGFAGTKLRGSAHNDPFKLKVCGTKDRGEWEREGGKIKRSGD
jgi:chorismate synthase